MTVSAVPKTMPVLSMSAPCEVVRGTRRRGVPGGHRDRPAFARYLPD
jgi:hypothetical protein